MRRPATLKSCTPCKDCPHRLIRGLCAGIRRRIRPSAAQPEVAAPAQCALCWLAHICAQAFVLTSPASDNCFASDPDRSSGSFDPGWNVLRSLCPPLKARIRITCSPPCPRPNSIAWRRIWNRSNCCSATCSTNPAASSSTSISRPRRSCPCTTSWRTTPPPKSPAWATKARSAFRCSWEVIRPPSRAVVQTGGQGYRLKAQLLLQEFKRAGLMQQRVAGRDQGAAGCGLERGGARRTRSEHQSQASVPRFSFQPGQSRRLPSVFPRQRRTDIPPLRPLHRLPWYRCRSNQARNSCRPGPPRLIRLLLPKRSSADTAAGRSPRRRRH